MAKWLLKVGEDRFKCVAFKNLVGALLQYNDGGRISVSGSGPREMNLYKFVEGSIP